MQVFNTEGPHLQEAFGLLEGLLLFRGLTKGAYGGEWGKAPFQGVYVGPLPHLDL